MRRGQETRAEQKTFGRELSGVRRPAPDRELGRVRRHPLKFQAQNTTHNTTPNMTCLFCLNPRNQVPGTKTTSMAQAKFYPNPQN
jgi:hypothetical protein